MGPLIERHARFPRKVNAGFMQVRRARPHPAARATSAAPARRWPAAPAPAPRWSPASASAGSTPRVDVETRGGLLTIDWAGGDGQPVLMTGPAETVFEGEIEL